MRKNRWILLGATLAAALLLVLALTKPAVQPPEEKAGSIGRDPLKVPLLQHMAEAEAIRAGSEPGADLVVSGSGDEITVTVSEALQQKLGPDALGSLNLIGATESMSWNRYLQFLNDLHDLLVARFPDAHTDHHHDAEAGEPPDGGHRHEASETP